MTSCIGYVVRGEDSTTPVALMLSHERDSVGAEDIFKRLANESMGATEFMQKLMEANARIVSRPSLPIFWFQANHDEAQKVVTVYWPDAGSENSRPVFREAIWQ